ncbi:HAD-IB family phosphatase [Candidatus Pseudomonas adelgestsugas]|uniref:Haloacid dehalogenase-like hydrolase n=1 Tax=Candidatus Pseudomonas adelgestsugas TaxID=1302376 RepID=A0ABX5R995_9PSED|nr:HAD-IB family phosphatase [Candidatus Pseudomonas adelgestsugas]QAX82205.1 haloacid dehalogenase-like hydrolase [Candidatus Pseudomonas adelgestsugas]
MLNTNHMNTKVLSVFDFDGTLTYHDSFLQFLKFAFGHEKFYIGIVKLAVPGIRFLVRQIGHNELKEQLISIFMTGLEKAWIQRQAEVYCQRYWTKLMRPDGLQSVADEVKSGAIVTLCSASPAVILQPFTDRLGIQLIGTELEVVNEVLTGKLMGNNCRCENKVLRLKSIYGDLGKYRLRAWGDTRGDLELLAAAQDAHFQSFHSKKKKNRALR